MSPEPPAPAPGASPQHRPLAGSVAWRLAGTLARIGVGVVTVSVYARVLGMGQWGLLALFQAATAPLALLELGAGAASVKYVSEWVGRGDRGAAERVVQTTLLFNVAVGLAGAAALNAGAEWLATSAFAIPAADRALAITGFRIASAGWLVSLVAATFVGVLSAHQRFDLVTKLATVSSMASSVLGIVIALTGGTIVGVLAAQVTVAAATAWVAFAAAARLLPGLRRRPRWDAAAFRRSFSFGSWQAVAMLGGLLANWSDRYVLGARFAPRTLGFYSAALTLEQQLVSVFNEMGEVVFPAVSHRQGTGHLADARRLALLAGWLLTTVFGLAAAVLATVGGDFLSLWIGAETAREATGVLRLLCVGGVLGMADTGVYFYMLGVGRTRWSAALALTSGGCTIAVSLALVPALGIVGAAIGAVAGCLSQWILAVFAWRYELSEDVPFGSFAVHVFAPAASSLALLGVGIALHGRLPHAASWPGLMGEAALTVLVLGAVQAGVGELLPGGAQRRRDVVASFAPIFRRVFTAGRG